MMNEQQAINETVICRDCGCAMNLLDAHELVNGGFYHHAWSECVAALHEQLARYDKNVAGLADIVGIQCQDGNWNYDRYMRGLANGLLLAQSIMNHDAVYEPFGEPDEYLHDDTTELAARELRQTRPRLV
jgi:hypothetical protein